MRLGTSGLRGSKVNAPYEGCGDGLTWLAKDCRFLGAAFRLSRHIVYLCCADVLDSSTEWKVYLRDHNLYSQPCKMERLNTFIQI